MQKKFRLTKNEDFRRLIFKKKFVSNKTFTIYFLPNELNYSRFGLSVGKKHGNAVARNKVKRQLRMMIDEVFEFSKSYDYVFMVRESYHKQTFAKNLEELQKLKERIKEQ